MNNTHFVITNADGNPIAVVLKDATTSDRLKLAISEETGEVPDKVSSIDFNTVQYTGLAFEAEFDGQIYSYTLYPTWVY